MNRLLAVPTVVVLIGVGWPAVMLDGADLYLEFLRQNAVPAAVLLACWALILYWVTRRFAELALWRGTGRKLALRERNQG